MRFQDIEPFTRHSEWSVTVGLGYLLQHVADAENDMGLDLEPDFQRAHVWTEAQQTRFVEYFLRGGLSGRDLYFNHPNWRSVTKLEGPYVIVDGKQRLHALMRFMRNELPVFGYRLNEYTDSLRQIDSARVQWHVNNLKKKSEVLQWYLSLNFLGTPHTVEELERVRGLLLEEQLREKGG